MIRGQAANQIFYIDPTYSYTANPTRWATRRAAPRPPARLDRSVERASRLSLRALASRCTLAICLATASRCNCMAGLTVLRARDGEVLRPQLEGD